MLFRGGGGEPGVCVCQVWLFFVSVVREHVDVVC